MDIYKTKAGSREALLAAIARKREKAASSSRKSDSNEQGSGHSVANGSGSRSDGPASSGETERFTTPAPSHRRQPSSSEHGEESEESPSGRSESSEASYGSAVASESDYNSDYADSQQVGRVKPGTFRGKAPSLREASNLPTELALGLEKLSLGQGAEKVGKHGEDTAETANTPSETEEVESYGGGDFCSASDGLSAGSVHGPVKAARPLADNGEVTSKASHSVEVDEGKKEGKEKEHVEGGGGEDEEDVEEAVEVKKDKSISPMAREDFCLGKDGRFRLPWNMAVGLYPHQKEGLEWLWRLHEEGRGGILGDDMGLGKTRQVATFLAGLFRSNLASSALLVVPTTLLPQWHLEFKSVGITNCQEFSSSLSVARRGRFLEEFFQSSASGVMLTTYEMVQGIPPDRITWDYVVLDEGHLAKNPSTKRFTQLKALSFDHCILLTGTPIQNALKELWALFDLCCTGLLGDYKEFRKTYEVKIVKGSDKDATVREKQEGNKASQALKAKIEPYMLRRMKRDIFPSRRNKGGVQPVHLPGMPPPLPHKNDLIVWLQITNRQKQLYETFINSPLVKELREGAEEHKKGRAFLAIQMLKCICDHPCLLSENAISDIREALEAGIEGTGSAASKDEAQRAMSTLQKFLDKPEFINDPRASCKIRFLAHLLPNIVSEGHRVLIFSQTKMMLSQAEVILKKLKIDFLRIDGDVRPDTREQRVQQFQQGNKAPVFLLTTKVGGVGLTLHSADRVVILDPSWNPSTDNQSVDRAYRIGQRNDVVVYRLITAGTVEEKIYGKQVLKDRIVRSATAKETNDLRYFNSYELSTLFELSHYGFSRSETMEKLAELHKPESVMTEELGKHISALTEPEFILGVSHHDLLYSKEDEALPDIPQDEDAASARPPKQFPGAQAQAHTRRPLAPTQGGHWQGINAGSNTAPGILLAAQKGVPQPYELMEYERNRAAEAVRWAKKGHGELLERIARQEKLLTKSNLSLPDGGALVRRKIENLTAEAQVAAENLRRAEQDLAKLSLSPA